MTVYLCDPFDAHVDMAQATKSANLNKAWALRAKVI